MHEYDLREFGIYLFIYFENVFEEIVLYVYGGGGWKRKRCN